MDCTEIDQKIINAGISGNEEDLKFLINYKNQRLSLHTLLEDLLKIQTFNSKGGPCYNGIFDAIAKYSNSKYIINNIDIKNIMKELISGKYKSSHDLINQELNLRKLLIISSSLLSKI